MGFKGSSDLSTSSGKSSETSLEVSRILEWRRCHFARHGELQPTTMESHCVSIISLSHSLGSSMSFFAKRDRHRFKNPELHPKDCHTMPREPLHGAKVTVASAWQTGCWGLHSSVQTLHIVYLGLYCREQKDRPTFTSAYSDSSVHQRQWADWSSKFWCGFIYTFLCSSFNTSCLVFALPLFRCYLTYGYVVLSPTFFCRIFSTSLV